MNLQPLPTSCLRVQGRLEVLSDGGLPQLEEARDRGHLEACDACRLEHESHLALLAALKRAVPVDLGPDCARVTDEVLARCAARRPARRIRRATPMLIAAAAAVLLLFLLGRGAPDLVMPSERQMAALGGVLERLPSWAEVVRGLENLSRGLS